MSDGSRYHKDSLTCAHKRYPLGSKLKVTNIKNGKSVVVKVTDRCGGRRIIDLSYAAAKEIGLIAAGVATVRVERYFEFKGVPYKQEQEFNLPELDYEVTEGKPIGVSQWMDADDIKEFKDVFTHKKDRKALKHETKNARTEDKTPKTNTKKNKTETKTKTEVKP